MPGRHLDTFLATLTRVYGVDRDGHVHALTVAEFFAAPVGDARLEWVAYSPERARRIADKIRQN
jgi:hypothetical protein